MIAADVVRAGAAGTIGVLSLTGAIELWHLIALAAVFGFGEAFFGPAFTSIVPQIVPRNLLLQANSLDQFIRPFAFLLVGPALGGWIVAAFGPGEAFVLDAATFLVSATAIFLIRRRGAVEREEEEAGAGASILRDLREGLTFVRAHAWLWGTLLAAAVFLLAYWGPGRGARPLPRPQRARRDRWRFRPGARLRRSRVARRRARPRPAGPPAPPHHGHVLGFDDRVACARGFRSRRGRLAAPGDQPARGDALHGRDGDLGHTDADARPRRGCSDASRASTGSSRRAWSRSRSPSPVPCPLPWARRPRWWWPESQRPSP